MTLDNLYRLGNALQQATGIPRQTIASAVKRGEISTTSTACGAILVDVRHVQQWAARWRKKGQGFQNEGQTQ
jgi:hypothetical protein